MCDHEYEVITEIKKEVDYLGRREEVVGRRKECKKCKHSTIETSFYKLY